MPRILLAFATWLMLIAVILACLAFPYGEFTTKHPSGGHSSTFTVVPKG